MDEDQEDESNQETPNTPDPNVYQPDQETDDVEIDGRIRRVNERLRRMSIVPYPQFNEEFLCQDSLTVEGGFSTGWAINYIDCGKQAQRVGPPPHPTFPCCSIESATLVCDQISASSDVCGFVAFDDSGRVFLTRTRVSSGSFSNQGPPACVSNASTLTWTSTKVETADPDTCEVSCDSCSGSGTCSVAFGCPPTGPCITTVIATCTPGVACGISNLEEASGCGWTGTSCGGHLGAPAICGECVLTPGSTEVVTSATEKTLNFDEDFSTYTTIHSTATITLSDETLNSCDQAIADLPAYDDDFVDPCEAAKNSNALYCFIERFRYKFTFPDPLTEECTICWIERTFDEDMNPIGDEHMCETIAAGETESSVHEALEPEENGTKTVVFPVGACCTDGVCTVTDEASCGGTYEGDSCAANPCSPNPCPPPP